MNKIIPVAIAIIHKENKFLLTERKGGNEDDEKIMMPVWHFPGGAVEFGEEVHTAIKREIKEELALAITIEQQLPIFSAVRSKWHGLLIPHVCSIQGGENIILNEESIRYGWFTYEEVRELHVLPFVVEMLDEAQILLKKS